MESVMDSPDPVKKNTRNDPDVRLMLRVRRGDAEAFEQIVSGWQNRLVTLFLHHMGDHATAEDLAQEVFMRVYRSRATYKPKACFSTWIYTIANNVASDLRQRAYRRHERGISPSPGTSSGAGGLDQIAVDASGQMPSRQVDRTELRGIVQQALGSLGERQRMALLLSKFERCSYEEIAEAMNLSIPAVKSLLFRARDNLRIALEPYLQDGHGIPAASSTNNGETDGHAITQSMDHLGSDNQRYIALRSPTS